MTLALAPAPTAPEAPTAAAPEDEAAGLWADACLAAALTAIDPPGLGGLVLRAHAGPVRDRWLALIRDFLPEAAPWRRVPLSIADGRLLGGLDLAATLSAGRPVAERGLLAEADGGVVVLAMAERLSASTAAKIGAVTDRGGIVLERDGVAIETPTRFGVIALDEGIAEDERPPAALSDRLAFRIALDTVPLRTAEPPPFDATDIAAARGLLDAIETPPRTLEALCAAALALGVE
ncbi:MAG: magnesium chelatase ATPase subunit D, partial [Alphaproteobacteria bacterium]|nr:magnesium chelatase ATPase subunit D [Alphaproteobacteria bacterium]